MPNIPISPLCRRKSYVSIDECVLKMRWGKQLQSIHSSSSDGSLSSGSPHSSPLQPQIQPQQQVAPSFSLSSAASNNSYNPVTGYQSNNSQQMKLHQPSALRTRNAIPIVNPSTGMRVPSPPSSISPAMMQQQAYTRHW